MDKSDNKSPDKSDLAAYEENLFGVLFGFHKKLMDLVRNSGLKDDQLKVVSERVKQLLADVTAETKRTQNLDPAGPLESAYQEIKRMVDELSESHQGGGVGDHPDQCG